MNRRLRMVGLACAVLACSSVLDGCRWLRAGSTSDPYSPEYTESDLVLENGRQEGAMGEVDGYAAETFLEQGYSYDGYSHVRLESQGDGWWVMSLIDISGASLDQLEPGIVYATATSGVLEEGQPQITVTGCSGPSQGNYTYDTQADRTELEIEDLGDGVRRAHFRTWYTRYDASTDEQLTEGTFDYRTVR